jgi:hypothetical protein
MRKIVASLIVAASFAAVTAHATPDHPAPTPTETASPAPAPSPAPTPTPGH